MSRTICWFSSGAASAVMTKLVLAENPDALVVYCDTGSEDEDNYRFMRDCEAWFGKPVTSIKSATFSNIDEVFEKRKFHAGMHGAPCTSEMKVAPRLDFQLPSDVNLWGYTADNKDARRFNNMKENYPLMEQRAPLIERGVTKEGCFSLLESAGLKRPRVYDMGFPNGNCIGCVKASSPGYWAMVRHHFPEVFDRRVDQDRRFGRNRLEIKGERICLDQLPEDWPLRAPDMPRCDFLCHIAEMELVA